MILTLSVTILGSWHSLSFSSLSSFPAAELRRIAGCSPGGGLASWEISSGGLADGEPAKPSACSTEKHSCNLHSETLAFHAMWCGVVNTTEMPNRIQQIVNWSEMSMMRIMKCVPKSEWCVCWSDTLQSWFWCVSSSVKQWENRALTVRSELTEHSAEAAS